MLRRGTEEAHDFGVDRGMKRNQQGEIVRLSPYYQLRCSCGWRGRRITDPGPAQSKDRMTEWEAHFEST